jgi:hypothetical protein
MMMFELFASAQKGVVYLPVVSLSSYLPVIAQIALMILVISLSGVFGAWLMFQRLAKKVLALESTAQIPAKSPEPDATKPAPESAFFVPAEDLSSQMEPAANVKKPVRISGARARKKEKARLRAEAKAEAAKQRNLLLPTVSGDEPLVRHKRTLFVTRAPAVSASVIPAVRAETPAASHPALKGSSRLVLARSPRQLVRASVTGRAQVPADDSRASTQTFLVNDWFPMDN